MTSAAAPAAAWIQSFSGRKVPIAEPRPDVVFIEDIAHALAQSCRFNGHCRFHYSVAQHSLLVMHGTSPELALRALLHDAAEAYIGDMVTPMKRLPQFAAPYLELEDRWLLAIGERFGLGDKLTNANMHADIRNADLRALWTEKRDVMNQGPDWTDTPAAQPYRFVRIVERSPASVERDFLRTAMALGCK
jgi:uncharacterized protein